MAAGVFFASESELATLKNTFTVDDTPTDPTTVTLTVTSPTQTVTSYATADLDNPSVGVYTKDVACSEAGTWQYQWVGTGAAADVAEGTWQVQESTLGRLYATVEALKSRLAMQSDRTLDDLELHGACFAASRHIEQYCERTFWRTATGTSRSFEPTGLWCLELPVFNDLVSVSALATDASGDGVYETTWQTTDYQLAPVNNDAAPETRPYTEIRAVGAQTFPIPSGPGLRTNLIQVTGVWGWPAVPAMIRQAALILAEELYKLRDAPFGVAGFGDMGVVRVRENPKVAMLAGPYRRNPFKVA